MRPTYLLALVLINGCGSDETVEQTRQGRLAASTELLSAQLGEFKVEHSGGMSVELSFGADVDLDLYVTGPLSETVYFANHTSKSGGEIIGDIRCDSEGPHVEKVIYKTPLPGRYRVGVDFPDRCSGEPAPTAYAARVLHPGEELRKSGSVLFEQFDVSVLEFEISE